MPRLRAVLDTNVLVSGTFWLGTPKVLLDRSRRGDYDGLTGDPIMVELERVLGDPRKSFRLSPVEIGRVLRELGSFLIRGEAAPFPGALPDRGDDAVLAVAYGGSATHIVSGDPDLLNLTEWKGIKILSPRQFLDLL